MNTTIDLTGLVNGVLLPFVQAIILALLALLATYLRGRFKIAKGSAADQQLQQAVAGAAGLAYRMLATQGARLSDVDLHNAAMAAGVNYVLAQAPAALKVAGITPDAVQAMVQAEFGRLIGASPTEGLAPPAASPAVPAMPLPPAPVPVPVQVVGDPAPIA